MTRIRTEIKMRRLKNLLRKPFLWVVVLFVLFTGWVTYLNVRSYQGSLNINVGGDADTNTNARFKTFDAFSTIFKTSRPYAFLENNYPEPRLSEPIETDTRLTRKILRSPIYIHAKRLPINLDPNTSVNFKILFKSGTPLHLSPTDNRRKIFNWEPLFLPELVGKFPISRVANHAIYLTSQGRPDPLTRTGPWGLSNISSWIYTHLKKGSLIKTDGAKINQLDFITQATQPAWGDGITTINLPLRSEDYTLYTYLNQPLNLKISKRDLNRAEGADILEIKIFDSKDSLVLERKIGGDGNESSDKRQGAAQALAIENHQLPRSGVYKITLQDGSAGRKANDFEITEISVNSGKLVFEGLLVPQKAASVFTGPGINLVSLEIFHDTAVQHPTVKTEFGDHIAPLTEVKKPKKINLSKIDQIAEIVLPKGDVRLERKGFFSFSPEAYFEPLDYFIIKQSTAESDTLIVPYFQFGTDGTFYKAEKTYRWGDLYPDKNGEIIFALKTEPDAEVYVDMVEISFHPSF